MSVFESESSFDEYLYKAKRIDKGVQHLEKKLTNVKNLGLSFAPEETKNAALKVLEDYEEEVNAMKENCERCLREEKEILEEYIDNSKGVTNFISDVIDDLNIIEKRLKTSGNYLSYDEATCDIDKDTSANDSESINEENMNESESSNVSSIISAYRTSPNNFVNKIEEPLQEMIKEKLLIDSPLNGDNTSNICASLYETPLGISKISSKLSEKSYESLNICKTPLNRSTRKPVCYVEDVCRTPIDPGISLASMKLLGKSNIKTKVYKNDSIFGNRKNE